MGKNEHFVFAPFSESQIECLDKRQERLDMHPYTCVMCREPLTAYRDGWSCDYCHQYTQNWAHRADTEFKPGQPFDRP